jgi:hypothetical protein
VGICVGVVEGVGVGNTEVFDCYKGKMKKSCLYIFGPKSIDRHGNHLFSLINVMHVFKGFCWCLSFRPFFSLPISKLCRSHTNCVGQKHHEWHFIDGQQWGVVSDMFVGCAFIKWWHSGQVAGRLL